MNPITIKCEQCQAVVNSQGTFSLWWHWESESWRITGALCFACLHAERRTGAPQATIGLAGNKVSSSGRPTYHAGELDVRVMQAVDGIARLTLVLPGGKRTGPADAVIRRIEFWRPGAEGPERDVRPFRVILWLEVSEFFG